MDFDPESLDRIRLEELRERRSIKWRKYPPDVLPAFVAEMDFPLAPPVAEALTAAVARSDTGYVHPGGLLEAYAGWAGKQLGWEVDPAAMTPVPDVMTGVAICLEFFTEPGDGVVVNPPVYRPFFEVVEEVGRTVVASPLRQEGGRYAIDLADLEAKFAAGATAYLLCNPHNPVGRVWDAATLEQVAVLADRYTVLVLADEIHAPLVLPGATHVPYLAVAGEADAVVLTAASKGWNLAGLKCGLMVAGSRRVRRRFDGISDRLENGTGLFGVIAAEAAFRNGQPWLDAVVEYLDGNRRLLAELLADRLPAVRYSPPEASYLAWLDCADLGLPDPTATFLERGRLATYPGTDFGGPATTVRVNIGTTRAILTGIVDRMAASL
ncbi:MAG: MalY/PatB family protein [Mycobacteriales bacterium]